MIIIVCIFFYKIMTYERFFIFFPKIKKQQIICVFCIFWKWCNIFDRYCTYKTEKTKHLSDMYFVHSIFHVTDWKASFQYKERPINS